MRSGIPELGIKPYVKGSTNYAAIRANHFPLLQLPLPPVAEQMKLVREVADAAKELDDLVAKQRASLKLLEAVLQASLRGLFAKGDKQVINSDA
jgi:restriction endonuclease S subunit